MYESEVLEIIICMLNRNNGVEMMEYCADILMDGLMIREAKIPENGQHGGYNENRYPVDFRTLAFRQS